MIECYYRIATILWEHLKRLLNDQSARSVAHGLVRLVRDTHQPEPECRYTFQCTATDTRAPDVQGASLVVCPSTTIPPKVEGALTLAGRNCNLFTGKDELKETTVLEKGLNVHALTCFT